MPSKRPPTSKTRHRRSVRDGKGRDGKGGDGKGRKKSDSLTGDLQNLMEKCPSAESLNAEVIMPFVQALVTVCDARGYVFNIYGDHCNIAVTPEAHAEPLYRLIDSYLDEAGLG